jgi:hypothetical protein
MIFQDTEARFGSCVKLVRALPSSFFGIPALVSLSSVRRTANSATRHPDDVTYGRSNAFSVDVF